VPIVLPEDHRDLPMEDGRPRLLALLDREDCLGRIMTPGVIYSLADRPCSSCKSGKRATPGVTVALVKMPVDDPDRPYRLHALLRRARRAVGDAVTATN
jgi:hypothetical protein